MSIGSGRNILCCWKEMEKQKAEIEENLEAMGFKGTDVFVATFRVPQYWLLTILGDYLLEEWFDLGLGWEVSEKVLERERKIV